MFEMIASILTGGATGLIGTLLSSVMDYFKEKQRHAHEMDKLKFEKEIMAMEIAGKDRVATIQAETALTTQSIRADRATYSHNSASKWLVFVDVVRGLIRPVITVGLCVTVTIFWFDTQDETIKKQIIDTVLYLTTAVVLWWFGSRRKVKNR